MALFSNTLADVAIGVDHKVLYACQCQELKSISKLYFCKHCTKLRCSSCVTHEVDSFYCPNCLENMPSAEAKLKRNRCANCFDCPSCGHTLSVRATTVLGNPLQEITKDTPVKKMHYLSCSFCRWTTRDVGLPDQVTPSGGWPEREMGASKIMASLLTYYKQVAHSDKLEKERQKLSKRRTNIYMMDRFGYGLGLGKKGSPLSSILSRSSSVMPNEKEIEAPVASEVIEELEPIPDSYYTQPLVIDKALTLEQKLREAGHQEASMKNLYPKHKHLMVRRSQRCKECEHNIFKPEFNPSSIKFKIQLGCLQYCPMVQILKHDNFIFNEPAQIVLSITNPLDTLMTIHFGKVDEKYSAVNPETAEITVPSVTVPIAAKDATVEFEIGTSTAEVFDDDPSIVHSRGANKVCVYASVIPRQDTGKITASFKMTYEYKMITTPLIRKTEGESAPKSEEHLISLPVNVQLNFNDLNSSLS